MTYSHKFFTLEISNCPNKLNSDDIKNALHDKLGISSSVINWDKSDKSEVK